MSIQPSSAALIACLLAASAAAQDDAAGVDYLRQVKPLLKRRCFACHGRLHQKSGLRVDTAAGIRRGGESGPAITAGRAADSLLVQVLDGSAGFRMPPEEEGPPLTASEIALIKSWITQGAAAPANEPLPANPTSYWSYQPAKRPQIPSRFQTNWTRNPIDSLILETLNKHGLSAQQPAKPEVLLRRVYLDLIGLPPTAAELTAFLDDPSPAAYERAVDDLLQRPQYGERWGRHWMDVWRYSDWYGSRGGNEIRYSQRHIWRWRDWIVESLNRNTGYDRMLMEMIAGDELAPANPEVARATGYLGRNWYKFDRDVWMFDAVEHTAQAFLGLTLRCARCHDHKFDPISHRDYYQFRAFFEPHHVRIDRIPGSAATEKDSKIGQVLKDGLSRVYDKQLEADTYLFLRGDPRNPDKSESLKPAVPAALGTLHIPVTPVSLPLMSFYPALQPRIVADLVRQAEQQRAAAQTAIQQADAERLKLETQLQALQAAAADAPADAPPDVFLHDTFDAADDSTWNPLNGKWTYTDGSVVQSEVTSFATLVTREDHPQNMKVHLVYRALKAGSYRSIGFSFDYQDGGNSQDVYTSTNDTRQTVQAFHRLNGKQTYPAQATVNVKLKVGQVVRLDVTIRDSQLKIQIDGKNQLDYVLPVPRRPGKFSLWVHKGTAEFLDLKIERDRISAGELKTKLLRSEHELAVRRQKQAIAVAELEALRRRIAAEQSRYSQEPDPALYGVAATAEKQVALATAELKRLQAQHHLLVQQRAQVPKKAIQEAEKQLQTAVKQLQAARSALDTPSEKYAPLGTVYPRQSSGRRLALARWIANRQNPRTARVAVNQMWLRHFGQPLVPTVSDFGHHGRPPSHPRLLDWLAVELMDQDWKMKPLHKLIVMSNTYGMTTSDHGEQRSRDPDNVYLWRMNARRMEAEIVRDSLLFVAGSLNLTRGGPEIPESQGETNLRRSLYFRNTPNEKMPFLELFDVADPNACYRRDESIVPQQSLAMTNSALALDQSRLLAAKLAADKTPDGKRLSDRTLITAAFQRILSRAPSPREQAACQRFLARQIERFTTNTADSSVFSGKSPATRKAAPDAGQRAFENLVMVLFNHNDFVTIR